MNMNKALMTMLATLFICVGQASAADGTTYSVGTNMGGVVSNIDNCTLLSSAVTIELSADVKGAVNCGPLSSTGNDQGMIFFGTCHANGSNKERSYTCTAADVTAGTNGCTAEETITITGRAAYLGSSNGGVIGLQNLNDAVCSDTTIVNRINTQVSDCKAASGPDKC